MTIVASPRVRDSAGARRNYRFRTTVWSLRAIILFAFLAVWQWKGSSNAVSTLEFSTPGRVLGRLGEWSHDAGWWSGFGTTLQEAFGGYVVGVVASLVIVAITAPSKWATRFLEPFIAAANALPKVALAPLFILWFGIGLESKVLFVASVIAFIVFYGIHSGLRTIDLTLVANLRVLGASRLNLLRQIYLPAIISQIIASLRLSAAWALLSAVVGEYLASNHGLGFVIAVGQQSLHTDIVLAGIIVVAVVAVILDRLLVLIEGRITRWKPVR